MWISSPTSRRRFTRTTPSLPSRSDERAEDKVSRKGHRNSSVWSVVLLRHVRGLCSHSFGFALKRQSPHMLRKQGIRISYYIFLLGSLFIIYRSVSNTAAITSWWNLSLRFHMGKKSIRKFQNRSKTFPMMGFLMKPPNGSSVTKPSRLEVLHNFVEAGMFTKEFVSNDTSVSPYHAFDDDEIRRRNVMAGLHRDLIENDASQSNKCTRTAFHRAYYPNCNAFHEIDVLFDPGEGVLGLGYFRMVLSYKSGDNESYVLKILNMELNFDYESMEMIRIDALVMESLASSPRIVNIYGHCATSVATEDMPQEIEFQIINGTGYRTAKEIQQQESIVNDVSPQNNFSPDKKLVLALQMAEAIADLHGFKNGVIVHGDIQLCQYLFNRDGQLKLNDFNRAELMLWDTEKQEYCRFKSGLVYGNYRSPEEDEDEPLNEQIDVFSLGNNFYGLLTGLWVFYENQDDEIVQKKVKKAMLPFIDDRYRYNRSFAESSLVKAIELCLKHDPDERASIFEVVKFLRTAVEKNAALLASS